MPVPVKVKIAGQMVPLVFNEPVSITHLSDTTPTEAFAPVRCACAVVNVLQADVACIDTCCRSRHVGTCEACGDALELELQYTVSDERITLDVVREKRGTLVR